MTCCQRTTSWSGSTGFSIFGWLHEEVAEPYDAEVGRPSIDPEIALRLMLAGFLLGLVHDRRLMREAQVKLAIRWFCGYGLHETLPDHSSLTRIRQRLGRVLPPDLLAHRACLTGARITKAESRRRVGSIRRESLCGIGRSGLSMLSCPLQC